MKKRYESCILATAVLPIDENGNLMEDVFREEVRGLRADGISHIYIFGTAGEGYDQSFDEFKHITSVFLEEMKGAHAMVGVISSSAAEAKRRVAAAYELGVREFQISLPCWAVPDDSEVINFFHFICDAFPDCLFFDYNVSRSGRVLPYELFCRLADEIPNLAGVKYTAVDAMVLYKLAAGDCPLMFFVGDGGYATASMYGEVGYLISLGLIDRKLMWDYFNAGQKKDGKTLFACSSKIMEFHRIVVGEIGAAADGAYDKAIAKVCQNDLPLRLRPPYRYCSEEGFARIMEGLARL